MPGSLVVDASFVFRILVPSPGQTRLRAQIESWEQEGIVLCAPTLWLYEFTSSLCKIVRLGDLDAVEGEDILAATQDLDIQPVPPDLAQMERAYEWTRRLNRAAAYDSFYLALAEALQCELWTADRRLKNAVDLPWVCLIS